MGKTQYKPWGHLQWLPQSLRMVFLGEGPVFNLLKQVELWEALTDQQRADFKTDVPVQVSKRQNSLEETKDLIKSCLQVLAFLSAEVIFVFTTHPQGPAMTLALMLAAAHGLSIAVLLRAIIPPPHTLVTNFVPPLEWVKGEQGKRWTKNDDELFLARDLDYLLGLNALTQFTKRCLVAAAIFIALGQGVFFTFLYVHFI